MPENIDEFGVEEEELDPDMVDATFEGLSAMEE